MTIRHVSEQVLPPQGKSTKVHPDRFVPIAILSRSPIPYDRDVIIKGILKVSAFVLNWLICNPVIFLANIALQTAGNAIKWGLYGAGRVIRYVQSDPIAPPLPPSPQPKAPVIPEMSLAEQIAWSVAAVGTVYCLYEAGRFVQTDRFDPLILPAMRWLTKP